MKSSGEKITPEAFYQQLAQVEGPDLVAFARWVMENDFGVFAVRWRNPLSADRDDLRSIPNVSSQRYNIRTLQR
jgi:hypothetical protein